MEEVKKEIQEDVEIIVKEIPKQHIVKDVSFNLNTSQSGSASYITDVINGELCAVIIDAESPIQVKISLTEYSDIVLFEDVNFSGVKYIPLGIEPVFSDSDKLRYSLVNWFLNNRITFNIKGPFNTSIDFKLRYI